MTTFTFVAVIWSVCWLTIAVILSCWAVALKRWTVQQVRTWRVRKELEPRINRMAQEFRVRRDLPMTAETIRLAKLQQAREREECRRQTGLVVAEDGRVLFLVPRQSEVRIH